MKGRIFNVFYRVFKNKNIATVLSNIAYSVLLGYYYIVRLFLLKSNISLSTEEAYKKVNSVSPKPNGKYTYSERVIDENIDLSIVVPAYNVSQYVESCIESVIKQNINYNYELIIINDGSTDDTLNKLEKYRENENIRIISQENKGFSGARNVGIDLTKGKYIMFLDSDDVLCNNSINALLDKAYEKNADIVQGSYYEFFDENKRYYTNLKYKEVYDNNGNEIDGPGYPWGKIYKSSLFDKVRFPLGYWYEDTIISYIVYRLAKSYVAIEDIVYGYRKNYSSITYTSKRLPKVLDTYWIIEECLDILKDVAIDNDYIIYRKTIFQLSNLLYRRIHVLDEEIIKNTFVLACNLIDKIIVENSNENSSLLFRDLEYSFKNRNYKLWKLASFIV